MSDSEVALYSVMIKNIPEDRSGKAIAGFITDITNDYKQLKENLDSHDTLVSNAIDIFISSFGQIVSIQTPGQYTKLIKDLKELDL